MNIRQRLPMLIGSLALALALGAVEWRNANPDWRQYQPNGRVSTLVPTISDKPELCLTCHFGIEEISASHPVDVFGCVSCHGGDRLTLDVEEAHRDLLGPGGNPADMSVVEQTCGSADCHGGDPSASSGTNRNHIAHVQRSLQATYAGAINAVLQQHGLASEPQGVYAIAADIYGPPGTLDALAAFDAASFQHPAADAFAAECLHCHVSAEPIAQPYFYRGTGCAACHVPYTNAGLYEGDDPTIPREETGHPARHTLTLLMPYTQCAHCHARGRYSVAELQFSPRDPSTLSGARETDYQPHNAPRATLCERELDCIDCHNAAEAMGDGYLYSNLASVPLVECRTCHGTLDEPPALTTLTDPNDPAFRRDKLNDNYYLYEGDTVVLAPNGEALGAVRLAERRDERLVQTARVTGRTFSVPLVQGSACEQNVAQQEAHYCRECHGNP